MKIYPAIDLLDGRCVRLVQGDFNQKTEYSDNPLDVARRMQRGGAKFLHIVDLSGTKQGSTAQTDLILEIAAQTQLRIQTGGGIRSREQIERLLTGGIDRVVIGSLAAKQPDAVKAIIDEFGAEHITLAADVRFNAANQPDIATSGWQEQSSLSLWTFVERFCGSQDLPALLCTDIRRDGMLTGPNLDLYRQIHSRIPNLEVQASGGIASLTDLRDLRKLGAGAVIIGKALYEGKFTLEDALQC